MIKDIEKEVQQITKWIKEYVEKSHSKGVVVGNSGGKDSAVVIALATKALGKEMNPALIVSLLLGFMFIIIGNYLPKCKQNFTLGIKIKWTLENEENWNKTHRFAGKVWFIGGFIMLLTAFLTIEYALLSIIILIA